MMQQYKESVNIDKGVHIPSEDVKTTSEVSANIVKNVDGDVNKKSSWYQSDGASTFFHYICLIILGLLTWGLIWCACGDEWRWDGKWFRISGVAIVAWASGELLQSLTSLPPLLAALLTGIFARNMNILDMRQYTDIDMFFRKIYPVIILGKGSLGWDVKFMRDNWKQVASLGVLPWLAEVVTLAVCTNIFLGFPWLWGILLGSFYASLTCAILMPSVQHINSKTVGSRNWAQLVCTAGGTDTAASVAVYGIVYSYIFVEGSHIYRCVKAGLTLVAGVLLGAAWGSLAGVAPHPRDPYVTEIRVMFVLLGGLFGNFFTSLLGWGGVAGVAVLVCNATAATHWAHRGWKLNCNATSTAYRVMWSFCEPMVFAYTGTFFVLNSATSRTLTYGFAILFICLLVRLLVAALVCWNMTLKERLFICCTWVPKSIVEAVLSPVALNTVMMMGSQDQQEMEYAEDIVRLIVQAILITTPVGYLLTNHVGPRLLMKDNKDCENDCCPAKRKTSRGSQNENE